MLISNSTSCLGNRGGAQIESVSAMVPRTHYSMSTRPMGLEST